MLLSKALYHACFICGQRCKWWSRWPKLTLSVISDVTPIIYLFFFDLDYNGFNDFIANYLSCGSLQDYEELLMRVSEIPVNQYTASELTRICLRTKDPDADSDSIDADESDNDDGAVVRIICSFTF